MIIDTSAVIAILLDEPPRASLLATIQHATAASISTATLLEVSIVLQRKRTGISDEIVDMFLSSLGSDVVPATVEQVRIARIANRELGKGSGHPAQLNLLHVCARPRSSGTAPVHRNGLHAYRSGACHTELTDRFMA